MTSTIIKIGESDIPFFPVCEYNYFGQYASVCFATLLSNMEGHGKVYCSIYRSVFKSHSAIVLKTSKGYSFTTPFTNEVYGKIIAEAEKIEKMPASHEKTLYASIEIPDTSELFDSLLVGNNYIPKIILPYYMVAQLNSNKFSGLRISISNYFGEAETVLRNSVGLFNIYESEISFPNDSKLGKPIKVNTYGMRIKNEKGYFNYYLKRAY